MINERQGMVILEAERELQTVEILLSALPVSELGRERLEYAVETVRAGLAVLRPAVGLPLKAAA